MEEGREEYVESDVEGHETEEFDAGENGHENEGKEEIQKKAEKGLHGGLVAKGVEERVGHVLEWRRERRRTCSSDVKR